MTYTIQKTPKGEWLVLYYGKPHVTIIATCTSALWAQRIINALNQMEIEG